jgi:hypothetical protein
MDPPVLGEVDEITGSVAECIEAVLLDGSCEQVRVRDTGCLSQSTPLLARQRHELNDEQRVERPLRRCIAQDVAIARSFLEDRVEERGLRPDFNSGQV